MVKDKLSNRQQSMIDFISNFIGHNGYPPTIREIGRACGISSTSVVNYNLNKLEREGLLMRDREVSRGLRVDSHYNSNVRRIPLVGRIAASEPMPVPGDASPFGEDEGIDVTRDIVDMEEELFALQVKGDSMVDAMINDGDIVIMKPHHKVQNGDLVAIWLDDRAETTLKHFYNEGNRVRLQPANPTMKPIYIDNPERVQVQGKVVAIIRHT
jgi:repressor LexA